MTNRFTAWCQMTEQIFHRRFLTDTTYKCAALKKAARQHNPQLHIQVRVIWDFCSQTDLSQGRVRSSLRLSWINLLSVWMKTEVFTRDLFGCSSTGQKISEPIQQLCSISCTTSKHVTADRTWIHTVWKTFVPWNICMWSGNKTTTKHLLQQRRESVNAWETCSLLSTHWLGSVKAA